MKEPLSTVTTLTAAEQRIISIAKEIERLKGHPDLAGLLHGSGFREEADMITELIRAVRELDQTAPKPEWLPGPGSTGVEMGTDG